jgi:hypothetical protein
MTKIMKKIKRISHLQKERQRLRRRGDDMEKAIRQDWHSVCHELEPASLAREALTSCTSWVGRKFFSRQHSK